jgi:hypothetical protein
MQRYSAQEGTRTNHSDNESIKKARILIHKKAQGLEINHKRKNTEISKG